ncbi:MAG: hypothetical protein J2P38_02535 [Candidatus Dormibacteraeota bacterium]|nr:hypothetical protein [Candidatus Dormibacteraeota bacterium]
MAERTEARPDEHEGLAGTFHEKVISLDTMGLRLLAPTAAAIAVIVASAVFLATRDAGWPLVSLGAPTGSVLETVPLPVAVLATLAIILAWSFILAGSLHAHLALRVIGVGAYALVGLTSALSSASPLIAVLISIVVLSVVVAAIGLYVTDRGNHRQAPELHHRTRLRLPTFGWILLATTLIYGLLALRGLQNGQLGWFIYLELEVLQFLLIPVLLLAGTDFAEWAEVVSGRVSSLAEQLPRPAVVGAVVVAAGAILFWAYVVLPGRPTFSLTGTVRTLVPVAILAVPVCALGGLALRRPLSTRVPFWALAAGAVLLYLGILLASVASSFANPGPATPQDLPKLVAAHSTAGPRYSLLVPHGWSRADVPEGSVWSGVSDGRSARIILSSSPDPGERPLSLALAAPVTLEPGGSAGGWQMESVRTSVGGQPAEGDVWIKREAGEAWTLAGVRAGGQSPASRSLFDTVRESFTTGEGSEGAASAVTPGRFYLVWEGAVLLILIGAGLALLVVGQGEVATGGLYLVLVALFAGFGPNVQPALMALIGIQGLEAVAPFNLDIGGAYGALGAIALTSIVPGWRLPVPILRLVLVLTLGFAGLHFLYEGVFGTALGAGARFTLVQGVVLVAAMLWDVLMSGESFTNTGGLAVPRHTRVLIYLGYTVLVVTTVLFLSSVQIQGGGTAGQQFESDTWPQLGIAALGPPLLITFFLVNLRAWRHARPLPRPDALDQVDRSILIEAEPEGARRG